MNPFVATITIAAATSPGRPTAGGLPRPRSSSMRFERRARSDIAPETGSLEQDVRLFFQQTFGLLKTVPGLGEMLRALMADAQLDPAFGLQFRRELIDVRRAVLRSIIMRGVERGESAPGQMEVLIDIAFGAMWYRLLLGTGPLSAELQGRSPTGWLAAKGRAGCERRALRAKNSHMCRLFGFRSSSRSRVHRSLVTEKNSLQSQSREHKDGWGIAYYDATELPEIAHGLGPAHGDPEFERVSNLVSSRTVLAHVRLASVGRIHPLNAHPFVQGRWAFAHNGTVTDFATHRDEIEARIAPRFRGLIRGETDSERCFFLLMTFLQEQGPLENPSAEAVARALSSTLTLISRLTDAPEAKPSSMNFLITDGDLMLASRWNRTLFFSEHKKKAAGPSEPPRDRTPLHQFVISSEALTTEDHWHEVDPGTIVGVDRTLAFRTWRTEQL